MADVKIPDTEKLASGEFEVTAVADNPREWQGSKGGKMLSYRLTLKQGANSQDRVELAQKESTPAPKVGDKLTGDLTKRYYEAKGQIKSDFKFQKERTGPGGGGRAWKPRPDDAPVVYAAKQAQIVAQHSQNMALRILELAHTRLALVHPDGDGDLSGEAIALMETLGVELKDGDDNELGLVDAFARHASLAAADAWKREEDKQNVAKALAALS